MAPPSRRRSCKILSALQRPPDALGCTLWQGRRCGASHQPACPMSWPFHQDRQYSCGHPFLSCRSDDTVGIGDVGDLMCESCCRAQCGCGGADRWKGALNVAHRAEIGGSRFGLCCRCEAQQREERDQENHAQGSLFPQYSAPIQCRDRHSCWKAPFLNG